MQETLHLVAFVKRAKNRRKIIESFALQSTFLPSELVITIFHKSSATYFATVSRSLAELQEEGIVELINPEAKTGRTYRLTTQGKAVLAYLQRKPLAKH